MIPSLVLTRSSISKLLELSVLSDQWFASTTLACCTLGKICLPGDHGLPHTCHVSTSYVLRTVHFAIRYHSFPWVRSVTLLLYILMIHRLTFNVSIFAEIYLLLPLLAPLPELFTPVCLAITLHVFLSLVLLVEFLLAFLRFLLHALNPLTLLIIKIIFALGLHPRASWSWRLKAPIHPGITTIAAYWPEPAHPIGAGECKASPDTELWHVGWSLWSTAAISTYSAWVKDSSTKFLFLINLSYYLSS